MGTTRGRGDGHTDSTVRVLHVDDDPGIGDLTAAYLQRVDDRITVVSESSAHDGLERLDDADIDCIVSDYEMPGMDGIEFLEAVRQQYEALPFILFTGRGSEDVASEAISAGVTEYLQKDGSREQFELLANRVANVVYRRRAERRAARFERINEVIREVDAALVRESTRPDIERAVCETLGAANRYAFAWIGTVDGEQIAVRTSHPGTAYLDDLPMTLDLEDPTTDSPVSKAFIEGSVQVCERIDEEDPGAYWQQAALDHGFGSLAAVPLRHDTSDYGVMAVYGDEPGAFDETERGLLGDLGDNIAHAIHAAETTGALRESRSRVSALFENASDAIVYVEYDGDDPRVRDVNPAFERTFGYDRTDVIGEHVDDIVASPNRQPNARKISQRVHDGERVERQVTRETADGPREFLLRLVPLDAENDRITRGFAVYTDITEHKRRETELESLNERISRLHDITHRLQAATTAEEIYDLTITAAVDILEFDWCVMSVPEDGRFKLVATSEHTPFEVGDAPLTIDEGVGGRVFRTGESDRTDDVHADTDGEPAADAIRAALTVPIGEFGLFQAVSSWAAGFDENDQELAELLVAHVREALLRVEREAELERQNKRLDRFAAVVSHDLRNPLNVAQGRVDLAQTTDDVSHLDPATTALDRMNTIIDDVLTLTRGEPTADAEPVSLKDVVATAWTMVDTGDVRLGTTADCRIRADPDRLQRLLENLFRNSVEHGRADTIRVEPLDCEADGFAVADDGTGFEAVDAVFESGHSTATDGTGLGLAIVHRIADAHGWSVEAANGEEGARVEVTGVDVVRDEG